MKDSIAFNIQSPLSSLNQRASPLFFNQLGDKSFKYYQLVREYSYIEPVVLDEFEDLNEAKKALLAVVDNFNDLSLADGDSMHLSEDGMRASSFLHGKVYIKEVKAYDNHQNDGSN